MKLYHPTFAGKVREVPDSEVDAWVERAGARPPPRPPSPRATRRSRPPLRRPLRDIRASEPLMKGTTHGR